MDPSAPMDIDCTAPASMCLWSLPFGGTFSMVPYSTTFGVSSSPALGSGLAPAGWSGCGISTTQSYPSNPASTFVQTSSNSFSPTFCSSPTSFSTQSQTFGICQTSTGGFHQAQPASLGGSAGFLGQNNFAQSSATQDFSAIPQVEASVGGTVPSIQNGISGMPVRDKPASTQSSAAIVAAVNHAITYGFFNTPVI